jgi:hypothetical protein
MVNEETCVESIDAIPIDKLDAQLIRKAETST